MTQHKPDTDPADGHALRRGLGMFATGITVVTAHTQEGAPIGLTVNSFNAVSLHPPLVVWSLSIRLPIRHALEGCEYYAVNVLAEDQEAISRRFASKESDLFHGIDWQPGLNGAPLLEGCCAHFEVLNASRHPGGDHILFIGQIERFARFDREPLVYFRGKYRQLANP
ncbi:MAG TPA: flavin reductase family protein [Rhodocyclaceae bacterium]|nr:flavin reductase family protein [Rhodocyclaceae bacterium]